jgi:hypothetical protein
MGGYVYAIANDAMPGLVKIGATLRNPEDRLNEARATTWAPSWWGFPPRPLAGTPTRCLHGVDSTGGVSFSL